MYKASWVLMLSVGLMLTAGCKKDELRAKDARIAELESQGQATGTSLVQCKKDRENLNKLVKGYTGEINAMEAALAEAAAREARAAKRLEEYNSMLRQLKAMIDAGKLKVRIVRNKMVIELPEAVLFASGSAKLKQEGVKVLAELGDPCSPASRGVASSPVATLTTSPSRPSASPRTGSCLAPGGSVSPSS